MMWAEMPSSPSSKIWKRPTGPAPMMTVCASTGTPGPAPAAAALDCTMKRASSPESKKGSGIVPKLRGRLPLGVPAAACLPAPAPMSEPLAPMTTLLWFRLDLRLADQPALSAALGATDPIVPVFIWAPREEHPWAPGGASRWWLHRSLAALGAALERRGSRLILRAGEDSLAILRELARATGARRVLWNRRYEPAMIARDRRIK